MKKITPNAKLDTDDIRDVIANEVVKREIFEGDKADEAKKKIIKALKALEGKKAPSTQTEEKQVDK